MLAIASPLAITGCCQNHDRWNDFAEFVPIDVKPNTDWELGEDRTLLEDEDFKIGLPIILRGYRHEFIHADDKILVRRWMHKEGNPSPQLSEEPDPQHAEIEYRWNLTTKACAEGATYRKGLSGTTHKQ